jgi:nucleoside 2-deoxyribosyltransferase
MKVVYVAGKFRGKTNWEIQQNVRRAEEVSLRVAELGAMPLCPHKNTEHFDGLLTAEFWLAGTLELMRRCDAVVLVEGWRNSSGTMAEIEEANRLGIPVYDGVEGLDWRVQP